MKNIVEYVEKEMRGFNALPWSPVDSLVLSQFAYIHFNDIVPGLSDDTPPVRIADLLKAENLAMMFRDLRDPKSNRRLLFGLAASPRFRDVKMCNYVDRHDVNSEKQFSAITFLLDDTTAYIAYRGTDSTVVGWKEDFNMTFISPVPAQLDGVDYLNAVAATIPCGLRIGGHSKGGNLAVYSAMECLPSVKNQILSIYNHDGPGFKNDVFKSEKYASIAQRIHITLPQSALIGLLMGQQEHYFVVESKQIGVMQHDPFSWLVIDGDFRYLKALTNSAERKSKTLNQWLSTLSDKKRELFVNTFYSVIEAAGVESIYDLSVDRQKKAAAMLAAIKGVDEETKHFISETIKSLVTLSVENLPLPLKKPNQVKTSLNGKKNKFQREKVFNQNG